MNFDQIFDNVFPSAVIGYRKPAQEFYRYIYDKLKNQISNLKKEEVVFWDNRERNVVAAREFGFKGEIYTEINKFIEYLTNMEILFK